MKRNARRSGGTETVTVIARPVRDNTGRTLIDLSPLTQITRELSRLFHVGVKAPQVVREEKRLRRARRKSRHIMGVMNDLGFFLAGMGVALMVMLGCQSKAPQTAVKAITDFAKR